MPELDAITVKGFKSIASVEDLRLGAMNVLIGSNGSGKSNFIDVFPFLRAIREGRLQDYVAKAGGAGRVLHFGAKVTPILQIAVSFQGGRNQYEIALEPTDTDALVPTSEVVSFWDKDWHPKPYRDPMPRFGPEAGIGKASAPIAAYVRQQLNRWRLYHFHDTSATSRLRSTSDVDDNRFLRPDAANLPAYLYFLREQHEDAYALIRNAVRRVAPFFDDFVLAPQRLNASRIRLEWQHRSSDSYFDAAALSDGTIRFIALAALFLQPAALRPSVILVDEPELGLHPYAVTMLASLVKQASVHTQVVLSTQSSLLLDHFEPDDVLVADLVDGGTQIRRLDGDRLEAWLEDYSLGQLWEKNEFGGRPGASGSGAALSPA